MEILSDPAGRPTVILRGGAKALAGENARPHLSISHDAGMALAFAVVESP